MTHFQVVAAVRNEAPTLRGFVEQLASLELSQDVKLSLLLIEDGSRDGTQDLIQELSKEYPWVSGVSLKKGLGQIAAVLFGVSLSQADAQIVMDVDRGHPAELIPEMISHYLLGSRCVQASRIDQARGWNLRKLGALTYNALTLWLTGVNLRKQNVFFRLIGPEFRTRSLADPRAAYFFRIPFTTQDLVSVKFLPFEYHERTAGQSKYPLGRLAIFALDGVLSLIPSSRLFLVTVTSFAFILWLLTSGWWSAGFALSAFVGFVHFRHWRMGATSLLDQITIQRTYGTVNDGTVVEGKQNARASAR